MGPPAAPPLRAAGLVKRYRRTQALSEVDLLVEAGQVVGLLGPNGAGKTTAVKIVLGLTRPDAGTAELFGVDSTDPAARRRVGYLPERFAYPGWLTGEAVLRDHARLAGLRGDEVEPAVVEAIGVVGLAGRGDDRVGGYSKGMQQRLGLAAALLGDPLLVVLDEPTSALDPLGRREVREVIRRLRGAGTAVLLNSHLLDEVEQVCDDAVVLDRGRVVAAGPLSTLVTVAEVRLQLDAVDDAALAVVGGFGQVAARDGDVLLLALDEADAVPDLLAALVAGGHRVRALVPLTQSLEDVFVGLVQGEGAS